MNTQTHNETSREQIEMGKLFAEMMNLLADTRKKESERESIYTEMQKREDEREKLRAETKWHPLFIVAGAFASGAIFVAAVAGFVKLFLP